MRRFPSHACAIDVTFVDVRRDELNLLLFEVSPKFLVRFSCNGFFSELKFAQCLLGNSDFLGQITLAKPEEASRGPY